MIGVVVQQPGTLDAGFGLLRAAFRQVGPPPSVDWHASTPQVHSLRQRDPETWRVFVSSEAPAIYRYVFGRLGHAADAEDVTSEVMEEAWRHAPKLEDRGLPARAWLFGIAANVVNRHRRRRFQRPPALSIEAFDGAGGDPGGRAQMLDLVREIAALDRGYAEVITLRFVHDLSLQETAVALGTTVDSVKGRQARALAKLRRRLDRH
jgi:RNA polymerase sigma-70 factor (ECF subfamily)